LGSSEIFSLEFCMDVSAGVRLVQAAELANIHGGVLDLPSSLPEPDTTLLVISRGDQPTPGYGLTLVDFRFEDEAKGLARMTVQWRTPPRDAILPQVITHPCLVVALADEPPQRIEVFDQYGAAIGSVELLNNLRP
jgi:hypothetical protein